MKQQDEKLSVLLDGGSDSGVDAAIDEVIADVNLQYRMRRYQMIGEVMRNELPQAIDAGFHANVMARIRANDASSARSAGQAADARNAFPLAARSWFRPFAGMALAASVAIVTVALWQPLQPQVGPGGDVVASSAGQVTADEQKIQQLAEQKIAGSPVPVSTRVQPGLRWKLENESPVLQQKLNAYLVNHTEYSNSMQGLIPQARVAGFDAQQ